MSKMVYFANYVDPETGDMGMIHQELEFAPDAFPVYYKAEVTDPTLTAFHEPHEEADHDAKESA